MIEFFKQEKNLGVTDFYFTASKYGLHEDWGNLDYLAHVAKEAGINSKLIEIESIGWLDGFVDLEDRKILNLFKLYPWEWIFNEEFGEKITQSHTSFYEPAYKLLLSHKNFLVKIKEMFPESDLILDAHVDSKFLGDKSNFIRKPMLGREGQNVTRCGIEGVEINPLYDNNDYVLQEFVDLSNGQGENFILGSWIINNQAAGMCIREDNGIVKNGSKFIPHYFE